MDGKTTKPVENLNGRGLSKETLKWLISHTAQDIVWRLKDQTIQGIVNIMGYSEIQYSQQRLTYSCDILQDKPEDLPILFENILSNMKKLNTKPEAIFIIKSGGRIDTNQELIIIRGVEVNGVKAMMTFDVKRVENRLLPADNLNSSISFSQDIDLGEISDFFKIYHYGKQKNVQDLSSNMR